MDDINRVVELFESLCIPYSNGSKAFKIMKEAEKLGFNVSNVKSVGIIVTPTGFNPAKRFVTVMSHYDLIPKFNKSFLQGDKKIVVTDKFLKGPLDNTLTNAVLLYLMEEQDSFFNQSTQWRVVFTDFEEVGLHGARELVTRDSKSGVETFYVNLDITSDNFGCIGSMEYDDPNVHFFLSYAREALKDINIGFQRNREADDLSEVVNAQKEGFSFCIPTKETIHSFRNKVELSSLTEYPKALNAIIKAVESYLFSEVEGVRFSQIAKEIYGISYNNMHANLQVLHEEALVNCKTPEEFLDKCRQEAEDLKKRRSLQNGSTRFSIWEEGGVEEEMDVELLKLYAELIVKKIQDITIELAKRCLPKKYRGKSKVINAIKAAGEAWGEVYWEYFLVDEVYDTDSLFIYISMVHYQEELTGVMSTKEIDSFLIRFITELDKEIFLTHTTADTDWSMWDGKGYDFVMVQIISDIHPFTYVELDRFYKTLKK